MGDLEIRAGDSMAIGQSGTLTVEKKIEDVVLNVIEKLAVNGRELVTLYYGNDVSEWNAKLAKEPVETRSGDYKAELDYGDRPIYCHFVSAE